MKIKTLHMKAFGKFKDKTIDFTSGLNLVHGNNEAGKTTIQTFIQGMFFGFYKPYRKKKTYSSEYEKYLPWDQFEYSGSLVYEIDGKEIRLERNFLRGKDSLKIYDNLTGENITETFKYDGITRQHLPLGDLGVSQVLYNNTVNIRQNMGDVEKYSQEEFKQCYREIQNDVNTEINFNGILRRLEEKKKNIGRSGQSKSPIGVAIKQREKLQTALKEGEEAFDKISKNQELINAFQEQMKRIEEENQNLALESVVNRKKELLENHKKIKELEEENNRLLKIVKDWNGLEVFNSEALEGLKTIQNQIEQLSYQINYIDSEMNDIEDQLRQIRKTEESFRVSLGEHSWETISEDYESYTQRKKRNDDQGEVKKATWLWIGALLLLIVGGILAWNAIAFSESAKQSVSDLLLTAGGAMLFTGGIGMMVAFGLGRKNRRFKHKDILDETQHRILLKYHTETPDQYEAFVSRSRKIHVDLEQMKNEGELLTVQQSRRRAGYEVLFEQRRGVIREQRSRLGSYGVSSLEAYENGYKKSQQLREVKQKYNTNLQILEGLYENVKVEVDLEDRLNYVSTPHAEKLLKIGKEIARLEGENNTLMKGVTLPVELREAIKTLDDEIKNSEIEGKACEAALKIIEEIEKGTHHKSAPELNGLIGEVLGDITRKYNDIKIDEGMKIKVVDPKDGNFRETEKLSAGSIDQVQFALRYGINRYMDNQLPFILDEPFVRYDYSRKAQALALLANLGKTQQSILFTCNKEDEKILRLTGNKFNSIEL